MREGHRRLHTLSVVGLSGLIGCNATEDSGSRTPSIGLRRRETEDGMRARDGALPAGFIKGQAAWLRISKGELRQCRVSDNRSRMVRGSASDCACRNLVSES